MARRDRPGPYSLETLAALPAPALFEKDPAKLKPVLIAWFEGETGRTLYPMQVEMLLIEMLAYLWSLLATEGELAGRQRYAVLADGAWLEQNGANVTTPRLETSAALTTMRFHLAAAAAIQTIIPAGTRVSAGSEETTFLTLADLAIPAGALSGDVSARAAEAGAAANSLAPGAIATILDPVAGVGSAENVTASEGGADREDIELYRLRVANALEKVSEAGPRQGYAEYAMGASSAIIDVAVIRPQPCYIDIYPLTEAGPAGPDLRALVAAELDPETRRPHGDEVTVKPPVAVTYVIAMDVRATRDVQAEAEAAGQRVAERWRLVLGGGAEGGLSDTDVILAVRASVPGVTHVNVTSFDFIELDQWEFGVCTGVSAAVTLTGGA